MNFAAERFSNARGSPAFREWSFTSAPCEQSIHGPITDKSVFSVCRAVRRFMRFRSKPKADKCIMIRRRRQSRKLTQRPDCMENNKIKNALAVPRQNIVERWHRHTHSNVCVCVCVCKRCVRRALVKYHTYTYVTISALFGRRVDKKKKKQREIRGLISDFIIFFFFSVTQVE